MNNLKVLLNQYILFKIKIEINKEKKVKDINNAKIKANNKINKKNIL